ncbi:uracil-DNA glycosylase [Mycoplasma leonicaptivi]|uniref:uracil-DNA glycosylase n=1 Tax=Mycoplasma leonicaptivi TaxID=36742 RepID=UPI00048A10EC|nr:uracil-DNA glycosylase [Mycoplasma leonicaptivi]
MKDSFLKILQKEGQREYFQKIIKNLEKAQKEQKTIYPLQMDLFKPFDFFQIQDTKVVIVGQDPYTKPFVADGLCFSTSLSKTPASLKNIFNEVKKDYPNLSFNSNSLISWAKQNVLLLNSIFTVEYNKPHSHKNFGWQEFSSQIIYQILLSNPNVVILSLGETAHKTTKKAIDLFTKSQNNKLNPNVFYLSHPSPLGYRHSFKDSGVFKKINQILKQNNQTEIDWSTN